MKYVLRAFTPVIFIALANLIVIGQNPGKNVQKEGVKQNWKISKDYDGKTGKTTLELRLMPVTCVKEGCIFFNLRASYLGKTPIEVVDRYIFALYFFSKTSQPLPNSNLTLTIDGEILDTGPMTYAGQEENDGLIGHAYGIPLSNAEVNKLANAKKINVQIANVSFVFDEDHINAILDFHRQVSAH